MLCALLTATGLAAAPASAPTAMRTVEGMVLAVEPVAAGADLPSLLLRLEVEGTPLDILLAPAEALQESGFEVQSGDQVRARVFLADTGPLETHKIRNLSRGTMLTLRTLHRVPLWSGDGQWQGGPSRSPGGPGGPHGRGPGHGSR